LSADPFLDQRDATLAPLRRHAAEALWHLLTTGAPAAAGRAEQAEQALARALADAAAFAEAGRWLAEAEPGSASHRRLQRYRREALPHQGPAALREEIVGRAVAVEQTAATFRPRFEGGEAADHTLDRVLQREPDPRRRREAWEATRQLGTTLAPQVRALSSLRNRVARAQGFADHRALALHATEIDPAWLAARLRDLERETEAPHARLRARLDAQLAHRFGVPGEQLRPWHHPDRFGQRLPPEPGAADLDPHLPLGRIETAARRFFAAIGLPVDDLWEAADLLPRPGKQPHALCLAVDPPDDVRVLASLTAGARSMGTALHELGHARYDRHLDPSLPLLLRQPAHEAVTEGVAMLFGRQVHDPSWLARYVGLDADAPEATRAAARQRDDQLLFLRFALVMVRFEEALYADPDGDLEARWWALVQRLQGMRRPQGHEAPDWAAKLHIACYPVYYQNYILGELLASQLELALRRDLGTDAGGAPRWIDSPRTGAALGSWFREGATRPWPDVVRSATGGPLRTGPHVRRWSKEPR